MTKSILFFFFFFFFLCIFLSNAAERPGELYWKNQLSLPIPEFISSKISDLTPQQEEKFGKLLQEKALKQSLNQFCYAAKLLCGHHPPPPSDGPVFLGYSKGRHHPPRPSDGPVFLGYSKGRHHPPPTTTASDSFFRENKLKEGKLMFLPDIQDKMPPRAFLPRAILAKFPNNISELFNISDDKMMSKSLEDCQRVPSKGETKRCVGSIEDIIDFAISILGHDVVVRTTENLNGSKKQVMVGRVIGINGGKLTRSVSCHQSLFPYLLYYCHSVPKVRVYQAELLDPHSKAKINEGIAICHVDTTDWSPTHAAFLALGSGPGRIEVCHWIFENDMSWTVAE